MLQDYWTNWYQTNQPYLKKHMVQFKTPINLHEPVTSAPSYPPTYFISDEDHLSKVLNELSKQPKQTDERGYFVQYYTTSTKKPYHWQRFDAFNSVKPEAYKDHFQHALNELQKQKNAYDWYGIKIVAFSFDSLNPMQGVEILKQYCFEQLTQKKKTYINGKNASQEFLAKKGKMFTTKAGV